MRAGGIKFYLYHEIKCNTGVGIIFCWLGKDKLLVFWFGTWDVFNASEQIAVAISITNSE